jgi:hypothetical protein
MGEEKWTVPDGLREFAKSMEAHGKMLQRFKLPPELAESAKGLERSIQSFAKGFPSFDVRMPDTRLYDDSMAQFPEIHVMSRDKNPTIEPNRLVAFSERINAIAHEVDAEANPAKTALLAERLWAIANELRDLAKEGNS